MQNYKFSLRNWWRYADLNIRDGRKVSPVKLYARDSMSLNHFRTRFGVNFSHCHKDYV
ncbi:hypothetical protein HOLleu_29143 [Holothuria leucospilota]|uniref:Uncharacterized protein n=1 Tax=Holothuria leucospilota TaxID=206669 RepID=A0A9Q1BN17_HOLLE|nr:hypothetical protein HOLleu_29143 [Holothuria leucospilota]